MNKEEYEEKIEEIENLREEIEELEEQKEVFEDNENEDEYDDFLDEIYPEVKIGEITLNPSRVLRECDETAYRMGFNEFNNDKIYELEEEIENLREEIEELKDEIKENCCDKCGNEVNNEINICDKCKILMGLE